MDGWILMFSILIGIILFVLTVVRFKSTKCKKCGEKKREVYLPDGMDLEFIGWYCDDCDKEFLDDFYSGKLDLK